MNPTRKFRKQQYRKYVKQFFGYKYPGTVDRAHFRYMGYDAPSPFRVWLKAQLSRTA